MSKKKKIPPISHKKKRDDSSVADWEHITKLIEQLQEERKSIVNALRQAEHDYTEIGGSKAYFPAYLKETYGIDLSPDVAIFPTYSIIDVAKYEFFVLRYL